MGRGNHIHKSLVLNQSCRNMAYMPKLLFAIYFVQRGSGKTVQLAHWHPLMLAYENCGNVAWYQSSYCLLL